MIRILMHDTSPNVLRNTSINIIKEIASKRVDIAETLYRDYKIATSHCQVKLSDLKLVNPEEEIDRDMNIMEVLL